MDAAGTSRSGDPGTDAATVAALIADLAASSGGQPADLARLAGLLENRFGGRALAAGADLALLTAAEGLDAHGWGPRDVAEIVRRRAGTARVVLALDVLAAVASRGPRGAGARDAELADLGAETWWDRAAPLVEQWTTWRGVTRTEALVASLALVHLWRTLPSLPRLAVEAGVPEGVDPKVLARVRALLAKAESTAFPEEAEALSAKAQELMGRHALEQAMVGGSAGSGDRPASARRIWLDAPYTSAKSSLVHQVAAANRCRAVSLDALDMVTVVGDEADLGGVELLVTSLLVQADRAMIAAGRAAPQRSRTRSFRHAFLLAYATRIGERLAEAAHEAQARARAELGENLLPVLAARAEVVERTVGELFPRVTRRRFSVGNGAGWAAGRAAADAASLSPQRGALAPDRSGG
jgi:hypothetical protein